MKIVTFGTSLTLRGGWQSLLERTLSSCLHREVSILTVAQSGATSEWGYDHIRDVVRLQPDIIIMEFYANDASIIRLRSLTSSRETIARIMDRIKSELPESRLILQVMNPFFGLRASIRPYMETYIAAHLQEAAVRGLEVIDHRPAWGTLNPAQLTRQIPDGAHPTRDAARKIIVPTLARSILGSEC